MYTLFVQNSLNIAIIKNLDFVFKSLKDHDNK